jgi:hypothetical protein
VVSYFSNFAGKGDALLCEDSSCTNIARYQSTNQQNSKVVFCSVHARQIKSITLGGFVLHCRKGKVKQAIVRKIIERANSEGIPFEKLIWSKLAEAADRQLKVKRVKEPDTTYEGIKTTGKHIVVGGLYHHYSGNNRLNRKVVDIIDEGFSAKTVVYEDVYGGGRCIKSTFCKACPTVITVPPESLVITKRQKPKLALTQKPAESNRARVEEFMQKHPTAPVKEIAYRMELSEVTIYKYRKQIPSQQKRLVGIPRRILSNRYSKYRRG